MRKHDDSVENVDLDATFASGKDLTGNMMRSQLPITMVLPLGRYHFQMVATHNLIS
jgi:hypothetical protein